MNNSRFLQIHTLHSYTSALLNRDDTGQAKRLVYGDTSRTRISSQCLKYHWRMMENDPNSLQNLQGFVDSFRSRELVTEKVIKPLYAEYPDAVVDALAPIFQKFVYGDKANEGKDNRQTLLLGAPELDFLAMHAHKIAHIADGNDMIVKAVADEWQKKTSFKAILRKFEKNKIDIPEDLANVFSELKNKNFAVMCQNATLPAGLIAALFGRMVTSDPAANIEAPIYVSHAFTVHPAEVESDYFTAVDDLKKDGDSGADTIQETEITNGLFYGYVVIDLPGLISNLGGDRDLASRVVISLVHLIAEVSPGAKRGSTAPFGRADLMLIEAGDRQPRSLATAFRKAIDQDPEQAIAALSKEITWFDESYATGELRAHLALRSQIDGIDRMSLPDLAGWAGTRVSESPDV